MSFLKNVISIPDSYGSSQASDESATELSTPLTASFSSWENYDGAFIFSKPWPGNAAMSMTQVYTGKGSIRMI